VGPLHHCVEWKLLKLCGTVHSHKQPHAVFDVWVVRMFMSVHSPDVLSVSAIPNKAEASGSLFNSREGNRRVTCSEQYEAMMPPLVRHSASDDDGEHRDDDDDDDDGEESDEETNVPASQLHRGSVEGDEFVAIAEEDEESAPSCCSPGCQEWDRTRLRACLFCDHLTCVLHGPRGGSGCGRVACRCHHHRLDEIAHAERLRVSALKRTCCLCQRPSSPGSTYFTSGLCEGCSPVLAPDPVVPVEPDAEPMEEELQDIGEDRHPGPTEAMDRRLATTLGGMPGASNTMDYLTAQAQYPELFTPSVVATAGMLSTASKPGAQSQGDTGSSFSEVARPEVHSSSSSGTFFLFEPEVFDPECTDSFLQRR
jgi:hypothetical protein